MKKSALPVVILLVAGSAALGACNSFSSADVPADVADAEADQAVIGSDGARDPDGGGRPDSPDPRPPDGCSDGTREGFVGAPGIAACEGAWSLPGILANAQPKCGRAGGNQGTKPDGTGCGADDLCSSS